MIKRKNLINFTINQYKQKILESNNTRYNSKVKKELKRLKKVKELL